MQIIHSFRDKRERERLFLIDIKSTFIDEFLIVSYLEFCSVLVHSALNGFCWLVLDFFLIIKTKRQTQRERVQNLERERVKFGDTFSRISILI